MMWLTLGGGFLATLTTVPTPAPGCEVVVTLPATHAPALAPGKPPQANAGEASLVIRLPKAACWTSPIPHPRHPTPITIKPTPIPEAPPSPTPKPETPPSPAPKPKPAPTRTKGEIAAAAALAKLGTPFSWGGGAPSGPTRGVGRGANTTGFDCSGLALYAWSRAGVKLTHYTGAQFRQGRRIPLSGLRKGDLVFFGGGTGDPTHVGLYLGSGIMIHAPKTGDVVRKSQFLNSSYYRSVYRGAVRPG
ncbi:NlpC/P60 family protein [Nonomuraea typhae]|uniref:NlpC/P60 family protein n=1 Tax=Nonomuraea typhae TaxID=2603600 RepID=UPI0012F9D0B0|nr:NlpC/P60 family protein [Nonomuraea typhae]